ILDYCRGLSDNDPGLLLTAAHQYEKAGRPLPRAQALEAAGMALAANGDTADATVALSSAVTVYSELGADWDLTRTRAALHAYGCLPGPRLRPDPRSGSPVSRSPSPLCMPADAA